MKGTLISKSPLAMASGAAESYQPTMELSDSQVLRRCLKHVLHVFQVSSRRQPWDKLHETGLLLLLLRSNDPRAEHRYTRKASDLNLSAPSSRRLGFSQACGGATPLSSRDDVCSARHHWGSEPLSLLCLTSYTKP